MNKPLGRESISWSARRTLLQCNRRMLRGPMFHRVFERDRSNKVITTAGHVNDVAATSLPVTQCPAQCGDVDRQICFDH